MWNKDKAIYSYCFADNLENFTRSDAAVYFVWKALTQWIVWIFVLYSKLKMEFWPTIFTQGLEATIFTILSIKWKSLFTRLRFSYMCITCVIALSFWMGDSYVRIYQYTNVNVNNMHIYVATCVVPLSMTIRNSRKWYRTCKMHDVQCFALQNTTHNKISPELKCICTQARNQTFLEGVLNLSRCLKPYLQHQCRYMTWVEAWESLSLITPNPKGKEFINGNLRMTKNKGCIYLLNTQ